MTAVAQKSPDSELEIFIDWRQSPLAIGELPEAEIGWYVAPQQPGDEALKIVGHGLAGQASRATLTGGLPGRAYLISAAISTSEGRVVMRVILLHMRAA